MVCFLKAKVKTVYKTYVFGSQVGNMTTVMLKKNPSKQKLQALKNQANSRDQRVQFFKWPLEVGIIYESDESVFFVCLFYKNCSSLWHAGYQLQGQIRIDDDPFSSCLTSDQSRSHLRLRTDQGVTWPWIQNANSIIS